MTEGVESIAGYVPLLLYKALFSCHHIMYRITKVVLAAAVHVVLVLYKIFFSAFKKKHYFHLSLSLLYFFLVPFWHIRTNILNKKIFQLSLIYLFTQSLFKPYMIKQQRVGLERKDIIEIGKKKNTKIHI